MNGNEIVGSMVFMGIAVVNAAVFLEGHTNSRYRYKNVKIFLDLNLTLDCRINLSKKLGDDKSYGISDQSEN